MKVFINFAVIFIATVSFGANSIQEGTYSNDNEECIIEISSGDFFSTGVTHLIVEMGETKITPWGSFLTQKMDFATAQLNKKEYIDVDNAAGFGSYITGRLYFINDYVFAFQAAKVSPQGEIISELLVCKDLKLQK